MFTLKLLPLQKIKIPFEAQKKKMKEKKIVKLFELIDYCKRYY